MRRLLWSIALGVLTSMLLGAIATAIPYGITRDRILDALVTPGAIIAGFLFPQGVHTGGGVAYWGFVVMALNVLIYSAFWYAAFYALSKWRKYQNATSARN